MRRFAANKLGRQALKRASVMTMLAVMAFSVVGTAFLSLLTPASASAANTTFKYTDSNYTTIVGPYIGTSTAGQNSTLTFDKNSSGLYTANFYQQDFASGCKTGVIQVAYAGATKGYAYQTNGCGNGKQQVGGQSIAIQGGSTQNQNQSTGNNTGAPPVTQTDWGKQNLCDSLSSQIDQTQIKATLSNASISDFCMQGFLAALAKNASVPPVSTQAAAKCHLANSTVLNLLCQAYLTKTGYCYSKYPKNANNQAIYCQMGYDSAYPNRAYLTTLPVAQTVAQKKAAADAAAQTATADAACASDIPDGANQAQLLGDCATGYTGAVNGKTQAQACSGLTGIDLQYCNDGYGFGQAAATPSTPVANTQLGCSTFTDSPLSWVICPVVDTLVKLISWVDGLINTELRVDTSTVFCSSTDTCQAYYTAWQSFRNIALGLIVIAGLIVVISQALGIEILDAYTIRKTLPRLLIAVIAITLSWPLMKFVVVLSNNLGFGVKDLIDAPFSKLAPDIDFNFGGGIQTFFTGGGILAGATVAAVPVWVASGGIAILLAYAGTAALAVLVAVLVLILRQVAIILLMLLSPLAIVAYVLPNTRRLYKLWWESFSKALLMFPLIVAFIAAGRVFSAIAFHNSGPINGLIGFGAYFAPYFMIPLTFKMAGSTMGAVGNFVNGRAQGGFDNLRKRRGESRQARIKAARTGGLYRNQLKPFEYRLPFDKMRGKEKRKGSLDKMLNGLTNQTIDAQDGWRILAADKGGRLGRAVFGRQARDLRSRIGSDQIKHTAEAAKEADISYHAGRAIGGQHQYIAESLKKYDKEKGLTGRKGSAYKALEDNFAHHNADGTVKKNTDGSVAWRAPKGEKEFKQLAGIYSHGGQGARIAAAELASKAIELDTFKGSGKDETQRTDTEFLGMMVAAKAGRLENHELEKYYNDMAEHGDQEEAKKRLDTLQDLAKPLRTSQARNYGLAFEEAKRKDGSTYMRAKNVYEDPAGEEAQKSVRRTGSADIGNGKSEDLIREDGHPTAWAESLIAASSDYKSESYVDEDTGYMKVRPIYENGKMVKKDEKGLNEAKAQRAKIQAIEGYAQGDTGVGGAVYKIMKEADIKFKFGDPDAVRDTRDQAKRTPQQEQQQQQQQQDDGGQKPNPFNTAGG